MKVATWQGKRSAAAILLATFDRYCFTALGAMESARLLCILASMRRRRTHPTTVQPAA
jgi:hypothetical protein